MDLTMGIEQPYVGHLGRTAQTSVLISSASGPVFPANVYTCVNATQNPELREALLAGTLNHVACPFSDQVYKLAIPLRYHNEALRLYVLLIPEELRHEEFKRRSELLEELARERELLPSYLAGFHTVFTFAQLEALEANPPRIEPAQPEEATTIGAAPGQAADAGEHEARNREAQARLDEQRRQLEQERHNIGITREQLDEVSTRLERESARLDEALEGVAAERATLHALREQLEEQRRELDFQKLSAEQAQLRLSQGGHDEPVESTQVVTDDQFIEVVRAPLASERLVEEVDDYDIEEIDEPADRLADDEEDFAAEATQITTGLLRASKSSKPTQVRVTEIDYDQVPATFDPKISAGRHYALDPAGDLVLGIWRLPNARAEQFVGAARRVFIQYREVDSFPMLALVLAAVDAKEQAIESIAWPINVNYKQDQLVLDKLASEQRARIAIYGDSGGLAAAFELALPLAENIAWARERAERYLTTNKVDATAFSTASRTYVADDFERLGTMRHNFDKDSFAQATKASQAKLAAGIVGYWSLGDIYDYLIGIRCFPIMDFRAIQRRVVQQAIEWGIFINMALQSVALEEGLASDSRTLAERLIANFAEVTVGIRSNDLDPIQQWENWDALLELASLVGISPDPSVIELAEISLKRAQEHQENIDAGEISEAVEDDDEVELDAGQFQAMADAVDFDELVVARKSESTGVTYFLPDSALIDAFDDMATMPREDLELMLEDGNGRLEAAQVLIERFGSAATSAVLEASETMNATEIAALAKFFETKADGLETELVRCVETSGPSATYIAARALVALRSTTAIPVLLEALIDPARQGNKQQLAQALARYGERLMAPLTRAIKRDNGGDSLIILLTYLEHARPGTLTELSRDRSKPLREAARVARTQLQPHGN
ncbi:MAG: hypothetical protein H0U74_01625 [Bradymonadaceae bacterium]|nr:hypothetical protein [Lujinxingiaceae bacterium]